MDPARTQPVDRDPRDSSGVEQGQVALGTDPLLADTDGDGVVDGMDAFPMDATHSQAVPNPSDHTPPVITLQEPTNATPIP